MFATSCGGNGESTGTDDSDPEAVRVVASMYPLEYFAGRVGGDRVRVERVVPAGADAHDFEPTPGDLRKIAGADLIVYNGLGFESWIDALLDSGDAPEAAVQASSESIALRFRPDEIGSEPDHEDGHLDPHMWLDPMLAVTQVTAIKNGLIEIDPEGSATYEGNADDLVVQLTALDGRYSDALRSCSGDTFVTSHDSFNYMAGRYGLNAVGISGINPESEPSPRTLADLSDAVTEFGIRYVLVSPIDSERLSDTLARETGVHALQLHSLQNLTRDQRDAGETYLSLMDANLESLAIALECQQ